MRPVITYWSLIRVWKCLAAPNQAQYSVGHGYINKLNWAWAIKIFWWALTMNLVHTKIFFTIYFILKFFFLNFFYYLVHTKIFFTISPIIFIF